MPNPLAFLMLAIWPAVAVILYRRLAPGPALIWTLLGAYLLLPPPPAAFDFPLVPPLDKNTIPSLVAFILTLFVLRPQTRVIPRGPVVQALILIFVFSPVGTFVTNTEPITYGSVALPGMQLTEAVALVMLQFLLLVPFLLAQAVLAEDDGRHALATALLAGGLVYSLPMLAEVRLSPQINIWVYGYFQHDFAQMIRGGGFRPIVFLYHGLWAAFFTLTAMVAALSLYRGGPTRGRLGYLIAGGYLAVVLAVCKSLAPALYGLILIPLVLFLKPHWQVRIAALGVLVVLAYPVLRQADLIPADKLVAQAERIDTDRAASLEFRLDNEEVLLARASEKPLFGWGSWGRNQIYDPASQESLTISDGRWIITMGVFGWVGLIAEFGLLAIPFLALWRQARRPGAVVPPLTGPLALLLSVNLFDLLPNATITPITWLIAGALLGCAETMRRTYRPPVIDPLRTVL